MIFYLKIGVRKIILYDNNDISMTEYEKILDKEIKNGKTLIINFRIVEIPLLKCYNDCYKNYNNKFDWIMFFEVDEFLYINKKIIEEFVGDKNLLNVM